MTEEVDCLWCGGTGDEPGLEPPPVPCMVCDGTGTAEVLEVRLADDPPRLRVIRGGLES